MANQNQQKQVSQVAWQAGQWLDTRNLSLPIDDLGVLQGATVVDRIRTGNGRLIDLDWHLERFTQGVHALGLSPLEADLQQLCIECVERKRAFSGSPGSRIPDVSLVLLATPGTSDSNRQSRPLANLILYTTELPRERLKQFYTRGQDLVCVDRSVIPAASWSPQIKTRSRLHYYLSEIEATSILPGSMALLATPNGDLADTAIANILAVKDRTLFTPPESDVLQGVTLRRIKQLASEIGLGIVCRPITAEFAFEADELLCCGTTALLWPVRRLVQASSPEETKREWNEPNGGQVYRQLSEQIKRWLGYDYRAPFAD